MSRDRSTPTALWLDRPSTDAVVSALVVAALLAADQRWNVDFLGAMKFEDRLGLYTDLITIAGIFLAFSATGLAAYLALSGGNAEKLRRLAHKQILQQWISCLAGTSLVLLMIIVAKVGDRSGSAADWARWTAVAAVVLLVTKAARMIYVFAQLAGVAAAPKFKRRKSNKQPQLRKVG